MRCPLNSMLHLLCLRNYTQLTAVSEVDSTKQKTQTKKQTKNKTRECGWGLKPSSRQLNTVRHTTPPSPSLSPLLRCLSQSKYKAQAYREREFNRLASTHSGLAVPITLLERQRWEMWTRKCMEYSFQDSAK